MNRMSKIPGKDLVIELTKRVIISGITRTIINTILPIAISIYSLSYIDGKELIWYIPIIVMIASIFVYNLMAEILINKEKTKMIYLDLLDNAYRSHSNINRRSATKLYRLNKIIKKQLNNHIPVDKSIFDKMADFYTISFDICNSIYNIIEERYGIETECEVTIYQSNNEGISMIAYANKNDSPPLTYRRIYKKKCSQYLFGKLFKDLNATIHVCPNKQAVQNDFKFLEGSEKREDQVCQYIGIPLLTARKKIELLLQIDVSKPNVFGSTEEEVREYAENIFLPYMMLLNKAYERDLIFNGYYDIIVEYLKK